MGLRETIQRKPSLAVGMAVALLAAAVVTAARAYWPERKADLSQCFYSDDDGQTWFADSAFRVPPFDHNGKQAVVAEVYTYDNGNKQFCAYLARFTPTAKQQLEAALADAKSKNSPLGSVSLYRDPTFMRKGQQVKQPGGNNGWIQYDDPRATNVFSIHSPDGSVVDQAMVY